MKLPKLIKQVREGGEFGKYYGFAYRNFNSYSAIAAVIPLNILIAWCWRLYLWAKIPTKTDLGKYYQETWREAFTLGKTLGYKNGYQAGYRRGNKRGMSDF